jgi:hypothetical protein
VDTEPEAEAFARDIAGHPGEVNEGKTYSETSAAAQAERLDPDTAAELQAKADTLFKGETLRSIRLNAYGWWTVATIALYVGAALIVAGIVLAILAFLGVRHGAPFSSSPTGSTPVTKARGDEGSFVPSVSLGDQTEGILWYPR